LAESAIRQNFAVTRWANALAILVLIQFASGAVTLLTLAPIVMQIVHLLLADAVWITFILLSASALAEESVFVENKFPPKTQTSRNEI
jgi:heme A synthase